MARSSMRSTARHDPRVMTDNARPRARVSLVAALAAVAGLATAGIAAWHGNDAQPSAATAQDQPPARAQPSPAAKQQPQALAASEAPSFPAVPVHPALDGLSPGVGAVVDHRRVMRERLSPLLSGEVAAAMSAADTRALRRVLADPSDDDTVRNEVANVLRNAGDPELTAILSAVLDQPQETARFRSFAVQHLGQHWAMLRRTRDASAHAVRDRLAVLLDDPQEPVRQEALLALTAGGDAAGVALARRVLERPHDASLRALRHVAVHLAGDCDWREYAPQLRTLALRDTDPVVRLRSLHVLGRWHDVESRALFEAAAQSFDASLQLAGRQALAALARAAP